MSRKRFPRVWCGDHAINCPNPRLFTSRAWSQGIDYQGLAPCNRCEVCAQRRRDWFFHRCMRGLNKRRGQVWAFTGTFAQDTTLPGASIVWHRFMVRTRKEAGKRGRLVDGYVKSVELTERGRPHYHAILMFDGDVGKRFVERWWRRTGGAGPVARARLVHGNGVKAVRYCAKYVGKDTGQALKGARRWSSSRGFGSTAWIDPPVRKAEKDERRQRIEAAVARLPPDPPLVYPVLLTAILRGDLVDTAGQDLLHPPEPHWMPPERRRPPVPTLIPFEHRAAALLASLGAEKAVHG